MCLSSTFCSRSLHVARQVRCLRLVDLFLHILFYTSLAQLNVQNFSGPVNMLRAFPGCKY
jgi:hypothetical protein